MNKTLGTPGYETSTEDMQSSTVCSHRSPASCAMDLPSTSENQYPPLPPLRIGSTTVSCVVCDTFNENIRRASLSMDGEQPSSPLLPVSHPDWNVRKWQTRQIAKAFMDNTINSVLDEMGFTPIPESAPDSDPDDVLGSINFPRVDDTSEEEEEEDESIENEGILSAIQRHGLQRHTLQSLSEVTNRFRLSSSSPNRCSPSPSRIWELENRPHTGESPSRPLSIGSDFEILNKGPSSSSADGFDPTNDSYSDDEMIHHSGDNNPSSSCRSCDAVIAETSKSSFPSVNSSALPMDTDSYDFNEPRKPVKTAKTTCLNSHQDYSMKLDHDEESSKKRRDTSLPSVGKKRCIETTNEDSSLSLHSRTSPRLDDGLMSFTPHSSDRSSPTFGHFEFMDAAVAAAIQKKGLSALACQDL